jgi:hypothetical protein
MSIIAREVGRVCVGCGGAMTPTTLCRFVAIEADSSPYPWSDTHLNDFADSDEVGAWLCETCVAPVLDLVRRVIAAVAPPP